MGDESASAGSTGGTTGAKTPFTLSCPASFFEKADAPEGKRRRIAGLITTDRKDQDDEVVITKGLNFKKFLTQGFFNINHSKNPLDVIAIPDAEALRYVRPGEHLPDGRTSPGNGVWAEGVLLENYEPAEAIWRLGVALQKTKERSLGFSIEGNIGRRIGPMNKTVAEAEVTHTAVTHVPCNRDTAATMMQKSLEALDGLLREPLASVLTPAPAVVLAGATGSAASPILQKATAIAEVLRQFPTLSCERAGRIADQRLALALAQDLRSRLIRRAA